MIYTNPVLHLAIAYLWLNAGTYDKEYIKTHTVGFDKFADYVLGKEDGVAKTPEWASAKCGLHFFFAAKEMPSGQLQALKPVFAGS